jgi:hypothetical protein
MTISVDVDVVEVNDHVHDEGGLEPLLEGELLVEACDPDACHAASLRGR